MFTHLHERRGHVLTLLSRIDDNFAKETELLFECNFRSIYKIPLSLEKLRRVYLYA
jgi:hypothetical protein